MLGMILVRFKFKNKFKILYSVISKGKAATELSLKIHKNGDNKLVWKSVLIIQLKRDTMCSCKCCKYNIHYEITYIFRI